MEKAKAAVYTGVDQAFEIREFEVGPAPEGYAKMELIASGICGTDVHIQTGRLGIEPPKIIGHEFIGKVVEISSSDSKEYQIEEGDNGIVVIASPCGNCLLCKNGDDANCVNMGVTNGGDPFTAPHFHGGYAYYNFTPVKNLVKIPNEIDPKMASVFACPGPTAIHSFRLAKQAGFDLKTINVAVVQGIGPVGLFAITYLASLGIKSIVAVANSNDEKKVNLAKEMGATDVITLSDTSKEDIIEHINKLSNSLGADLVFEGSGNPKAIPLGMEMLRNRGAYLVPGQYSSSGSIEIQPQIITFKALQIIGSSQYSLSDVRDYLNFLQENTQLHDTILSLATSYKVEDINRAFDDIKARKNIKTVLVKDM